jgi:hypothetical protein
VEVKFSVEAGAAKGERWLIGFLGLSRVKGLLGQQGLLRRIKADAVKPAKMDGDS